MDTLADISKSISGREGTSTKTMDYYVIYDNYFRGARDSNLAIAEIGVFMGDGMKVLSKYFHNSKILGVDVILRDIDFSEYSNVTYMQCDQADKEKLRDIYTNFSSTGLDIIIDDASHIGSLSVKTFDALFPMLKIGGFYIVENWGTGYWDDWSDGSRFQPQTSETFDGMIPKRILSHDYGMVGFVKYLMDLVGLDDVQKAFPTQGKLRSPLDFLHIYPGVAVMKKRSELNL